MADLKPFAGMSQEETQQAVLYLLSAILEKLPRIDANDRLIVNTTEVTTGMTGSLTGLAALGTNNTPANGMSLHLANAGANHLYDRIVF